MLDLLAPMDAHDLSGSHCANSLHGEGWTSALGSACLQKVIITGASILHYNLLSKQSGPKYKYIVFNEMHWNIFNIVYMRSGSFMFCCGLKPGLSFLASPIGIGDGACSSRSVLWGDAGREEPGGTQS